jgi:hypothetical protein
MGNWRYRRMTRGKYGRPAENAACHKCGKQRPLSALKPSRMEKGTVICKDELHCLMRTMTR